MTSTFWPDREVEVVPEMYLRSVGLLVGLSWREDVIVWHEPSSAVLYLCSRDDSPVYDGPPFAMLDLEDE